MKIIEQFGAFFWSNAPRARFLCIDLEMEHDAVSFTEKVKLKECHEQIGELAGAEEAFLGKNDFPKIQVGVNSSLSEREDDSHWHHRGKKW